VKHAVQQAVMPGPRRIFKSAGTQESQEPPVHTGRALVRRNPPCGAARLPGATETLQALRLVKVLSELPLRMDGDPATPEKDQRRLADFPSIQDGNSANRAENPHPRRLLASAAGPLPPPAAALAPRRLTSTVGPGALAFWARIIQSPRRNATERTGMSRDRTFATDGIPQSADRTQWRVVYGCGGGLGAADGVTNMAVDAALLESVRAGASPVLRFYRWTPACLSLGRNQPARGRYDIASAARRGIDVVRRPTGGQAVLHDDELTYAVIAPVSAIGRPRAAYAAINRALVAGLRRVGVRATLAGAGLSPGVGRRGDPGVAAGRDWDAACFRRAERGEVAVEGAKLIGSAQRMEARTILQHGSILVGGSQAVAEELLISSSVSVSSSRAAPMTDPGSGWTTLERQLAGRPDFAALANAMRAGFAEVLGVGFEEGALTERERAEVDRQRALFASDRWTWRR
jgi:lipoyl(octanoyl) transferase